MSHVVSDSGEYRCGRSRVTGHLHKPEVMEFSISDGLSDGDVVWLDAE